MDNFEAHEAFKFLQGRRLYRIGYSSKQISELYDEFGFEEMYRIGIFCFARSLLKEKYEIDKSGKLQCVYTKKTN